jgi:hypothetical protein
MHKYAWQLGPAPAVKISNGTGATDFQCVPATNDVAALFGCGTLWLWFRFVRSIEELVLLHFFALGPIDVYPLKLTINPVCNAGNNRVIRNEIRRTGRRVGPEPVQVSTFKRIFLGDINAEQVGHNFGGAVVVPAEPNSANVIGKYVGWLKKNFPVVFVESSEVPRIEHVPVENQQACREFAGMYEVKKVGESFRLTDIATQVQIRNDNCVVHIIRYSASEDNMLDPRIKDKEDGIRLSKLKPGTKIVAIHQKQRVQNHGVGRQQNSCARRRVFPEPVEQPFYGSTWGGSMIKTDWIGHEMRMESAPKTDRL